MAQQEVMIGSLGPFLYDDATHKAVDTTGELSADKMTASAELEVGGTKVVGPQEGAIADPAAATSADLALTNLADPTYGGDFTSIQTEFNAARAEIEDLRVQLTAVLAALRAHGLIAP